VGCSFLFCFRFFLVFVLCLVFFRVFGARIWREVLEGGFLAARDAARVDCGWNRDVFVLLLCNRGVGEGSAPACSLFHLFSFLFGWAFRGSMRDATALSGTRAPSVECVVR
jgi:hypothetical protein